MRLTIRTRSATGLETLARSVLVWSALVASAGTATAQAVISDLNADGMDDLAVGAPVARDGRGTVPVYFGVRGIGIARDFADVVVEGNAAGDPSARP